MRNRLALLVLAGGFVVSMVGGAKAAMIIYTTTGIGSGFLNATPFSDQQFVITSIADTSDMIDISFAFGVNNMSMSIKPGSHTFSSPSGSCVDNPRPSPFHSVVERAPTFAEGIQE
jgi:hypothetical protein